MIDDNAIDYLINTIHILNDGKEIPELDTSIRDSIKDDKIKTLFESFERFLTDTQTKNLSNLTPEIQKENEQLLSEYKEKLNIISECSGDSIWITDIENQNITYASKSIFNLFGIKSEEAINKPFTRYIKPIIDDKEKKYLKELHRKILNGEPLSNECIQYSVTKDEGQIIYLETNNTIIYDHYGKPKEILGITRDISNRIKLEKALKESEEKYRLITDNTLDVIWRIDVKTLMYNYMSPSVMKMTGFTPEEILKVPLSEALVPESFQKVLSLLNKRKELPTDQEFIICERFQVYSKDGNIIDIEATANFIRNSDGEIIEIVCVSREISERIKVETALLKSEKKLTELLALQSVRNKQLIKQLNYLYNNMISAIAFFDIEGDTIKFSSCNNKWAQNIGYTPEKLEGFDISELKDKETAALYRRYILKAIEARQSIQEYLHWHDMDLHVILVPLINENTDKITSCGSIIYNISEKIRSDQKLKETEEKFISVFNNSKDAIVLMTKDLEIVEVNEGFYKLHGSTDYYRKNLIESYFPLKYHKTIRELIETLKNETLIPSFECEVYKHDGSLIPVEISTSAITLNNQEMLLSIIRDISAKKEMERNLTNVGTLIETRERKKLAADLHDNVGPLLSSMNMYLSVLSRKEELIPYDETLNDIRRILKDAILSIREISNDLSPHILHNFGLSAALDKFFETKKKLINIQINSNIEGFRFSEIKETMIYRIIIEAFNNTIKHSEADKLSVDIRRENNFIEVVYKDNGIGFNLNEKLNSQNRGLGLFSIINRIKLLEGTYAIETSPGNGFTLRIEFPINN